VKPKEGILSREQLDYLNQRTGILGGLSIGQEDIVMIVYPDKPADKLELSDLLLVKAQRFMPFFGEGSNESMKDSIHLIYNSDCNYSYLRAEVLYNPHNSESKLSNKHYNRLVELYPQRVNQIGSQLEEPLVHWMNG
jgi:hypothetical protein